MDRNHKIQTDETQLSKLIKIILKKANRYIFRSCALEITFLDVPFWSTTNKVNLNSCVIV